MHASHSTRKINKHINYSFSSESQCISSNAIVNNVNNALFGIHHIDWQLDKHHRMKKSNEMCASNHCGQSALIVQFEVTPSIDFIWCQSVYISYCKMQTIPGFRHFVFDANLTKRVCYGLVLLALHPLVNHFEGLIWMNQSSFYSEYFKICFKIHWIIFPPLQISLN